MSNIQLLLNVTDLEEFTECIKDAVVVKCRHSEKFSAIRLQNTPLRYNDWMHPRLRGLTTDREVLVSQKDDAWQLAGTIVHELAHVMVGVAAQHNEDWREACEALGLGLQNPAAIGITYTPDSFTTDIRAAIASAIEQFCKQHPKLVYDPTVTISFPEGREPLQFQLDGIRDMLRMSAMHNILLADEPGLGKTIETLGFINVTHPKRILVVCPNNLKLVWKRHFEDWCIHKDYEVEVASTQLYWWGDVVIMNYEAVIKWGDALKTQQWDLVVFDEMQYLKNPSAKRSKASYAIRGNTAIGITGTPIVNYPYELFPLIHYLDRPNWPEYGRFEAEHGSYSNNKLGRNLNRLNAKLRATIMIRRLKKDVLSELPKKRRQVVELEVSDDLRKVIEEEKKLFNSMKDGNDLAMVNLVNAMRNESDTAMDDIDWASIIEAMKYTRRYAFEEMAKIAHRIARAKLPFAIEHIEQVLENREKCIVYGHHRDVLEAVHDHFDGRSTLLLGGHINQSEVAMMAADRFSNDDNCVVFVGGITLAQGYSLKGSSTVVFIEEDWVPGLMTQAEDRSHGIGRGDSDAASLLIQHLVFEDSLDTAKAKLTIKKQKSIDRAVN